MSLKIFALPCPLSQQILKISTIKPVLGGPTVSALSHVNPLILSSPGPLDICSSCCSTLGQFHASPDTLLSLWSLLSLLYLTEAPCQQLLLIGPNSYQWKTENGKKFVDQLPLHSPLWWPIQKHRFSCSWSRDISSGSVTLYLFRNGGQPG